jgi:hypothetical protein
MKVSLLGWATTLAVVGAMAMPVMAGGGGGGGGGRGGRGGAAAGGGAGGMGAGGMGAGGMGAGGAAGGRMGGGVAQTPDQQADALQTVLGVTDANEWTVLKPKILKVLQDQALLAVANTRGGRGGGRGAAGGAAPAAPAADPTNPLSVSWTDLTTAVAATPAPSDADLKTKLAKVRDDRKKIQDTLTTDQAALQKVCTVRQEAILVTRGLLN